MKVFKILNLYACLGGNRYKWNEVAKEAGIEIHVTSVENDIELAKLYKARFPNDYVVVGDARQYLLDHYKEFHGIWSSPPCPKNSRARFWSSSNYYASTEAVYPDLTLYEQAIFLKHYFKGSFWVVENVIPYYDPLIPAQKRGRHLYWTNIKLPVDLREREIQIGAGANEVKRLCEFHEYDFYQYKGEQRIDKIARNLVDFEAGKTILETALGIIQKNNTQQMQLL